MNSYIILTYLPALYIPIHTTVGSLADAGSKAACDRFFKKENVPTVEVPGYAHIPTYLG
jgi:hypothetical protein